MYQILGDYFHKTTIKSIKCHIWPGKIRTGHFNILHLNFIYKGSPNSKIIRIDIVKFYHRSIVNIHDTSLYRFRNEEN